MKNTILLVTTNGMGRADDKLQQTLIAKYIELLAQHEDLPAAICFYTDGVKLVCEGSPILAQLQAIETRGVRLIVCSTCLNYFQLSDQIRVGIVGGMGDIMEAQRQAEKVITL